MLLSIIVLYHSMYKFSVYKTIIYKLLSEVRNKKRFRDSV